MIFVVFKVVLFKPEKKKSRSYTFITFPASQDFIAQGNGRAMPWHRSEVIGSIPVVQLAKLLHLQTVKIIPLISC